MSQLELQWWWWPALRTSKLRPCPRPMLWWWPQMRAQLPRSPPQGPTREDARTSGRSWNRPCIGCRTCCNGMPTPSEFFNACDPNLDVGEKTKSLETLKSTIIISIVTIILVNSININIITIGIINIIHTQSSLMNRHVVRNSE